MILGIQWGRDIIPALLVPRGRGVNTDLQYKVIIGLWNHRAVHLEEIINDSLKWQDTKSIYRNLLHFYTLITNYQKDKLRKLELDMTVIEQLSIYNCIKRIKYLEINVIKELKDPLHWKL